MAPVLGDVVRITVKMYQALNDIQNVYHALLSGTSAPDYQTMLANIKTAFQNLYTYIEGYTSDNVTFGSMALANLTQDEIGGTIAFTDPTAGSGSTNPMLPPQCAALLTFPTITPGVLGKKFLPPFTDAVLDDDGSPNSTALAGMANFANDVLDGVTGTDWELTFGAYNPTTEVFTEFIAGEARDLIATQRRRYSGSGT